MAKSREETPILVNFPKLNERIISNEYCFRIETKVSGSVEISIDDGPWTPCRCAVGFWWFDWQVGTPGKHKAVARIRQDNGSETMTFPRYFLVGSGSNGNGERPAVHVPVPAQVQSQAQIPVRKGTLRRIKK